jgi:hypothetical protein
MFRANFIPSRVIIRMTKIIVVMGIVEIMEMVMKTVIVIAKIIIPVVITARRTKIISLKLPKHSLLQKLVLWVSHP